MRSKQRPRGKLPRHIAFPQWCTPAQIRRALTVLERDPYRDIQDLINGFALESDTQAKRVSV